MLPEEILALKNDLIGYANFAEKMIGRALEGLIKKDKALLQEVKEKDEPKANSLDISIEEKCTLVIAKFQPAAKDLRTILKILQMNNDLERIADHAENIAESALFLIEKPPVKPLIDIPKMSEIATSMLRDSIDSFIHEDADLAQNVRDRDNIIDSLRDQVARELVTYMISDPSTIQRAFQLMRVASSLERIADLSTNICEDVVYIVEGKVIKHQIDKI